MAFRFRLQSILDYRRSLADQARMRMATAKLELRAAEEQLAQLNESHTTAFDAYSAEIDASLDVASVDNLGIHLQGIESMIADQSREVNHLQQEYAAARQELLQLELGARSIEKLRERQEGDWAAEIKRHEQTEMSELAAVFHRRTRGL